MWRPSLVGVDVLNLAQLETLRAVARTGSFSQAGRDLYLTQPAVSQRIHQIEDSFGVALFERVRGSNSVKLTPAGQRVLAFAEDTLATYGALHSALSGKDESAAPATVRVASAGLFVIRFAFAPIVKLAWRSYRPFPIRYILSPAAELEDLVKEGEADFAFVLYEHPSPELTSTPIAKNEWRLVASPQNPLLQEFESVLAGRLSLPMVMAPEGSAIRTSLERKAEAAGVALQVLIECPDIETIKELVVQGTGCAFLPDVAVQAELARGVLSEIRIDPFTESYTLYMLSLRSRTRLPETGHIIEAARLHYSCQTQCADELPHGTPYAPLA